MEAELDASASDQRHGIGSKLVNAGLNACRERGHKIVVVLGHPEFYPRFGFSAKLTQRLESPFGGGEAWMAMELVFDALRGVEGRVEFSPPFNVELETNPQFETRPKVGERVFGSVKQKFTVGND